MKLCPACGMPMPTAGTCACGHRIDTYKSFELYAPERANPGSGFDPTIYTEMAQLEDRNFWFRARNQLITHTARKNFPNANSVLEIGCGTGQVLRALDHAFPRAHLCGSELFVEGLAFAQERVPRATLMQMDATQIPFADEFDLIGAFDVLEHIEDDVSVLASAYRALKTGGGIILTVPQHPWLWSHQDEMAYHVRRYRRGELDRKLLNAGFRILHSTSFVSILLPLLVLSRLALRKHDDDPLREMRIGRMANASLASMLRLEFQMLRIGLRLPVGGSRLVAAVKEP